MHSNNGMINKILNWKIAKDKRLERYKRSGDPEMNIAVHLCMSTWCPESIIHTECRLADVLVICSYGDVCLEVAIRCRLWLSD